MNFGTMRWIRIPVKSGDFVEHDRDIPIVSRFLKGKPKRQESPKRAWQKATSPFCAIPISPMFFTCEGLWKRPVEVLY